MKTKQSADKKSSQIYINNTTYKKLCMTTFTNTKKRVDTPAVVLILSLPYYGLPSRLELKIPAAEYFDDL